MRLRVAVGWPSAVGWRAASPGWRAAPPGWRAASPEPEAPARSGTRRPHARAPRRRCGRDRRSRCPGTLASMSPLPPSGRPRPRRAAARRPGSCSWLPSREGAIHHPFSLRFGLGDPPSPLARTLGPPRPAGQGARLGERVSDHGKMPVPGVSGCVIG